MTKISKVVELEQVVIRFAGDSGDGMQLTGNLFSDSTAFAGNDFATFPDYPAEIRPPQGTVSGVSGFQVHFGHKPVHTTGDLCDVLVAMNPASIKANMRWLKPGTTIIFDVDSLTDKSLEKAGYVADPTTDDTLSQYKVIKAPISSLTLEALKDFGMDRKSMLKSKNMFALGIVMYLFNRDITQLNHYFETKFKNKPQVIEANKTVVAAGYSYADTLEIFANTYRIQPAELPKGKYRDISGNVATAWGLMAASERSGRQLFIGSYPITPATDVLHELSKHKSLGVVTVQAEDEIAGCASAVGAAFAGALAVTSTSGPGVCLKSEAMNLAVIAELPLVILNVQRGGPSTGLPTKSEQTDLLQALYGRNGESPMPVIAAKSPADCFDAAFMACKIAVEHMTPVVLLTDAFIANGSAAWRLPSLAEYPSITPQYVTADMAGKWTPFMRNEENGARYWALPGTEGFAHRIGGLEKSNETGAISTEPENHHKMTILRQEKVEKIPVPDVEVEGAEDADLFLVGFGGTDGHLRSAVAEMNKAGKKVALAHFTYINPLPKNTAEVLRKYKKVVVAEQNMGQFAMYLRSKVEGVHFNQFNQVKGQPFVVNELVEAFTNLLNE